MPMIFDLRLPTGKTLDAEKVAEGLYVVKGAYQEDQDYFAPSRLHLAKEPAPRSQERIPVARDDKSAF
jgi:hypothetical protein